MTTTLETDRLADLVTARLQMLELLAQLAGRQLSLVRDGQMSDLMKLLAAKQTVLNQLQQVEKLLDPFRQQDPERRVWRSDADRRRCQAAATRCDELLTATMDLERQGEAHMLIRRDAAASALAGMHAAAAASAAYAAGHATPATHVECEG
ncbi:MAG: hypothetical protein SFU86_18210 [Pirellulaceae bacterium]|nr:hypothetical protein [Pirellulaceae bacterium]